MENTSHIFICFSSKDEAVARKVVQFLEAEGLKCWISSRDVPPSQNYQETIVRALELAKGIVFLFSESSSASGEIKKELSLAGGAPVFPLRLSPVLPSGALRYELATRQWIDMFPDPEQALRARALDLRDRGPAAVACPTRIRTLSTLSPPRARAETTGDMIVDEAASLHERVADGRADELEAASLEIPA